MNTLKTEIKPGLSCEILASLHNEDGMGYVLCKKHHDKGYVTWAFDDRGYTHWGHYFDTDELKDAEEDFTKRAFGHPDTYCQRLETTKDRALWVVYDKSGSINKVVLETFSFSSSLLGKDWMQHLPPLTITVKQYNVLKKRVKVS